MASIKKKRGDFKVKIIVPSHRLFYVALEKLERNTLIFGMNQGDVCIFSGTALNFDNVFDLEKDLPQYLQI